jgi:protein SCO1/2
VNGFGSVLRRYRFAGLLWAIAPVTVVSAHPAPVAAAKPDSARALANLPIKNFSLTDQTGQLFEFAKIKGKVVVVGFGYTTCPDICPLITAAMRRVQEGLAPAERGAVFFLTITTDPEIDSPDVLASYGKRYGVDFANWSFLSGAEPALKRVWQNFGVKVNRKARGLIDHTSLTAVIDQAGTLRFAYHGAAPENKTMLQDIRLLLARRAQP